MNFKRFHESKNLFDVGRVRTSSIISVNSTTITKELSQYNIDIFSGTSGAGAALSTLCMVLDAGTYTLSFDVVTGNASLFLICACPYTSETRTPTKQLYDCATGKSFTLSEKSYVSLRVQQNTLAVVKDIMLNTGATPQPYEPYSSQVWHDTPHYIHNTSTDTITTPADIYANDTTATVGLKGNMYQASGVSPTTPIQPQETGERTMNLFDGLLIGGYFTSANFNTSGNEDVFKSIKVFLPAGTYTFSWGKNVNVVRSIIDDNYSQPAYTDVSSYTITSTTDGYVGVSFRDTTSSSTIWDVTTPIMLNTGSTALPYEPYGYKIPISSAGQTTPIYLGEAQTTRKIKKLVLIGGDDENWNINTSGSLPFFFVPLSDVAISGTEVICTHYSNADIRQSTVEIGIGLAGNAQIRVRPDNPSSYTLNTWKEWLAQQYANGTPFTVYYTLATPKTGIVNEPLRKIGDYADSVSGISIPVTAGGDTLSVDTTVQPSEVSVNYKGWHPVADVHEYDSNYTIATMQALTIAQLQTHTISDLQGGEWS